MIDQKQITVKKKITKHNQSKWKTKNQINHLWEDEQLYTCAGFSAPTTTIIFCMNTVKATVKNGEDGFEGKKTDL